MKKIVFAAIAAFVLSPIACAIAPETVSDPPLSPQSGGDGTCSGAGSQCYVWQGMVQVYGTCTRGGSCCTGCIDGAGVCNNGTIAPACGVGGQTCMNCDSGNECNTAVCVTGECAIGDKDSGGVCRNGYCNGDGACSSATCNVASDCAAPPSCYSVSCDSHHCDYAPTYGSPGCASLFCGPVSDGYGFGVCSGYPGYTPWYCDGASPVAGCKHPDPTNHAATWCCP